MKEKKVSIKQVLLAVSCFFVMAISQMIAVLISRALPINQAGANILLGCIYSGLTYIILKVLCEKGMGLNMSFFRMGKAKMKTIWVISAFVLPLSVSFVLMQLPGEFINHQRSLTEMLNPITGAIFIFGIGAGIVEEMVFRGMIMTTVEKRWNKVVAVLFPSMIFALIHVIGRDLDLQSILFLLVAGTSVGVLFSLITLQTGSIWNSAFMHGVWNAIMIGNVLQIGTKSSETAMFSYVLDSKSFFITGGRFGVEASVIAVTGYLIFSLLAFVLLRRKKAKVLA